MLLHSAPNELDCEYCTKQTKLCHLNHMHSTIILVLICGQHAWSLLANSNAWITEEDLVLPETQCQLR